MAAGLQGQRRRSLRPGEPHRLAPQPGEAPGGSCSPPGYSPAAPGPLIWGPAGMGGSAGGGSPQQGTAATLKPAWECPGACGGDLGCVCERAGNSRLFPRLHGNAHGQNFPSPEIWKMPQMCQQEFFFPSRLLPFKIFKIFRAPVRKWQSRSGCRLSPGLSECP